MENTQSEMFKDYSDIVTVEDISKMLHLSQVSVYNLLKKGKIKSVKAGCRYIVPKQSVIDFVRV